MNNLKCRKHEVVNVPRLHARYQCDGNSSNKSDSSGKKLQKIVGIKFN